jgi:hypothetical protein
MEIKLEIPIYDSNTGLKYKWEEGFELYIKSTTSKSIAILANKEGLISLANHLLNLAQTGIPAGYHMHFDENNFLEEGSLELIIEKK